MFRFDLITNAFATTSCLRGLENERMDVMVFGALEGPIFKTFLRRCRPHYCHSRRAFQTSWHQVEVRQMSNRIGY